MAKKSPSKPASLKGRILAGVGATSTVDVPELASDDFDGQLPIRPLTEIEQSDVDAAKVAGHVVRGTPGQGAEEHEATLEQVIAGQHRARRLAAAYGLSCEGERWTEAEVGRLPGKAVERIAKAVDELSGGDVLDGEMTSFRELPGGAGDGDAASDRGAAGDQPG